MVSLILINNSIFLRIFLLVIFMLLIVFLQFLISKTFIFYILLILYIGGIFLIILYLSTIRKILYKNYFVYFLPFLFIFLKIRNNSNIVLRKSRFSLVFIRINLFFLFIIMGMILIFMFFLSIVFRRFKEPIRNFYTKY